MKSLQYEDILPTVLLYLRLGGLREPTNCSRLSAILYKIYSSIIIYGCGLSAVGEILNVVFAEDKFATLQEYIYFAITDVNAAAKMFIFHGRRNKIKQLIESCLTQNWNPPRDDEEWKIINNCYRTSKLTTNILFYPILLCTLVYVLAPLFSGEKVLPFAAWYPCDLNTTVCYWLAFTHQVASSIPGSLTLVCIDCFIASYMMQISALLQVLSHRVVHTPSTFKTDDEMTNFKQERLYIKDCIDCHNDIQRIAALMSKTFIEIVFSQFCVTLSVVCTTIFYLVKTDPLSMEFLAALLYIIGMLVQFFYYCWYGNEVILNNDKLFTSIFEVDFTRLRNSSNKALLTMMIMAKVPMELFKGVVVKVNIESFINVLKLSYSIFNVLKSTI